MFAAPHRWSRWLPVLALLAEACTDGGATDGGTTDGGARDVATDRADVPADVAAIDVGPTDAGPIDVGSLPCPSAPPFDADDPRYRACTRPVYVAAGARFRRAVSYDGHTWESSMPPDPGEGDFFFNSAAIGNGIIVLVGGRGDSGVGLMTSFDGGATFDVVEEVPHSLFDLYSGTVAFFHGAFWLVANAGTWTSTDGMTWTGWTGDTLLPGGIRGSFGGHGHGWAVSDDVLIVANDNLHYRRYDGTNWSEDVVGDGTLLGYFMSIAYGGGRFVATGWDCCSGAGPENSSTGLRAATTDDGLTWPTVLTNGRGAPEFHGGSAVWNGTQFYASGLYDRHSYTSDDGLAWTIVPTNRAIGATLYYEGLYLGVEQDHGHIDSSTDGLTWTRDYESPEADADKSFNVIVAGRVLR